MNKKISIFDLLKYNFVILKDIDFFNIDGIDLIHDFFNIEIEENIIEYDKVEYIFKLIKKEKYCIPYKNSYFKT